VAPDAHASPAPQRPALRGSSLLAETAGGTAVRAVELVRHPAGGWFLLSAGAKEVLMCWHLTWRASGAAPPELHARVLSVQARPDDAFHRSWRAGAAAPSDAAGGDQRHLALAGFVAAGRLFAAVSSSDGTLSVWSLPADAGSGVRWSFVAALQLGRCPVLAMSHLAVGDAHWLVSGATDGAVAVWDVTSVTSVAAPQPAAAQTVLLPAAVLRCAHQSGVNAVCAARAPAALAAALGASPHAWVLVTGGDDQALNAILLELLPPSSDAGAARVRVAAAVRDPGAHVSALKSLWTDGAAVLTASLDQRLRMWCVRRRVRAPVRCRADAGLLAAGGSRHLAMLHLRLPLLRWTRRGWRAPATRTRRRPASTCGRGGAGVWLRGCAWLRWTHASLRCRTVKRWRRCRSPRAPATSWQSPGAGRKCFARARFKPKGRA
jgi:hypothetical protein